jgi:galactitol PTS system EIIA component
VSTIIFEYIKNCIDILLGLKQTIHIMGLGGMFMAHEIGEFLFDFDVEYDSKEDFFECISKKLFKKGYVVNTYSEELSKREKEFPTALITKHVNIAIPHTNAEFVEESFIYFTRLKTPLYFDEMSGKGGSIPVELIFVLGIHKDENQIKLLQKLMSLFMDEESVEFISKSNDSEEVKNLIRRSI